MSTSDTTSAGVPLLVQSTPSVGASLTVEATDVSPTVPRPPLSRFTFAWWNTNNFIHFAPVPGRPQRAPTSHEEYERKLQAIASAIEHMQTDSDPIHILGLAEISPSAARDLHRRTLGNRMNLITTHENAGQPFQPGIAIFTASNLPLREAPPLTAMDMPEGARPMPVVELSTTTAVIQFIFCHWPPPFGATQRESTSEMARYLRKSIYRFLNPQNAIIEPQSRHVVVVGDLNVEPFDEIFESTLPASRCRDWSRSSHHADQNVLRARMYNCAWRLIGEQHPHDGLAPVPPDIAGTHYNARDNKWSTYDHVLVSGSLLSLQVPYLDESSVKIFSHPSCLHGRPPRPRKFSHPPDTASGVSDHLPILGTIILER